MKNRLIEFALKCIIAIQVSALIVGGALAILEFVGRKDLSNKIINWSM